jgi:hypothetical protein
MILEDLIIESCTFISSLTGSGSTDVLQQRNTDESRKQQAISEYAPQRAVRAV